MNMQVILEQIQAIVGESCSFVDLFSPSFVEKYTKCATMEDFNENLPFKLSEVSVVNEEELAVFVKKYTDFDSWKQFLTQATLYYQN